MSINTIPGVATEIVIRRAPNNQKPITTGARDDAFRPVRSTLAAVAVHDSNGTRIKIGSRASVFLPISQKTVSGVVVWGNDAQIAVNTSRKLRTNEDGFYLLADIIFAAPEHITIVKRG